MGKKVFSNVIHILLNNWTTSALICWRACDLTHQVGGSQQQLFLGEGEDFFHSSTCVLSLVANLVFYKKRELHSRSRIVRKSIAPHKNLLFLLRRTTQRKRESMLCVREKKNIKERDVRQWEKKEWNCATVCPSKRKVCPVVSSFGEEYLVWKSDLGILKL